MIVTLTPNPSLDRTLALDALVRGAVARVQAASVEPAGKGVNVARALALHGHKTRAVLPVGGADGGELVRLLGPTGVDVAAVAVAQPVRSNVALVEPDGTTTKLNEAGPALEPREIDALLGALAEAAAGAEWVVLCGSLPPGAPDSLYAQAIAALRGTGVRLALDTSGPALRLGVAAGPALVKPNRDELAEAIGRTLATLGDALDAAQTLRERGAAAVLVSLGADGALLVDADGALHGEATATPVSTVGAGDATLAGFLSAGGTGAQALATALAWGAAAVALPGSRMPGPDDLVPAAVTIHDHVERARLLRD
ncbi:MAG: 1-phosphofructokinase [Sporichthyaceae bacterium]